MAAEYAPVYPHSMEEAKRNGGDLVELWAESHKANVGCACAIEIALGRDWAEGALSGGCANSIIQDYGYKRVAWVLANTIQRGGKVGFAEEDQTWARSQFIPPDKLEGYDFNQSWAVQCAPAKIAAFLAQYRHQTN